MAAIQRAFGPTKFWTVLVTLLLGGTWLGCSTTGQGRAGTPASPPAAVSLEMEPMKIEAKRGPAGLEIEAFDAAELFESAGKHESGGQWDDALRDYDRLLSAFPTSQYAKASLYNSALVLQEAKRWPDAAARFRTFVATYPDGNDAKDAWFQLGATYAEANQWSESREVFTKLLERTDLTADDRVEAMARKGFAQLSQGELDNADATFHAVFVLKQKWEAQAEERLQTDYYLAFCQYQLGQISHRKSNATPLRWPEHLMNADLEERARLLLQARRQYIDAVRYGNPRIASMAAFQIGTLFQEFYEALIALPPPKELEGDAKREAREVYGEEMRKKLRIVLEKAIRGHEHNIELFERLGVETEWVTKSRVAIAKLRDLLEPGAVYNFADPAAASHTDHPATGAAAPEEPTPGVRPSTERKPEPKPDPGVQRQIL